MSSVRTEQNFLNEEGKALNMRPRDYKKMSDPLPDAGLKPTGKIIFFYATVQTVENVFCFSLSLA